MSYSFLFYLAQLVGFWRTLFEPLFCFKWENFIFFIVNPTCLYFDDVIYDFIFMLTFILLLIFQNKYLQIDFGKLQKLTYMGFQGRSNSDAMVTSYYIKYSLDGQTWDLYGYIPPAQYYVSFWVTAYNALWFLSFVS